MELKRDILDLFKAWKDCENRKPILLQGARQIGKSWAMEQFGRTCFSHWARFDFAETTELASVFEGTKDPERIVKELSLFTSQPLIPGKTLIIFDEVQECEGALNSLKYFCERAPEYHIIAAGSLLGIAVKRKKMTVPVGKVEIMRMRPLTFREFLRAADETTFEWVERMDKAGFEKLPEIILSRLKLEYKRYLVSGGMPEAVKALLENKGMDAVDKVLQDILDLYDIDFSKYAEPGEIPRIRAVWHSLPSQLAKENRKFLYKVVKTGARAREYEDAVLWLNEAGMVHQIFRITKPAFPLSAYVETTAFKIYACDCGLLRRLARLSPEIILSENSIHYTEFKGALAENAVLQGLIGQFYDFPYYWTSEGKAEVEFVVEKGKEILPIEVKAEDNDGGRSLSVYNEKFKPAHRIRCSGKNLQYNDGLFSCPNPLVPWLAQFDLP